MEIIPQPRTKEEFSEDMIFQNEYSYKPLNDEYKSVTEYIEGFLKCSENAENKIIFELDKNLQKEEYILNADDDIKIISSSAEGAFRAAATLKQLVKYKNVKKQKIHDYPEIKNRGVMIDISRGKIPKYETLLELADILCDLKYNQLQLYMDDFVFEYEHFKEYCSDTMPITKKELISFKEYCKKRFITLVPNQNGFGHMGKWLEKTGLAHLGITRDDGKNPETLNPFKEESIQLVDTIYQDILPYFDSEWVNVGMDEPVSLGMGETKEGCEKEGKIKVYVDYLNKILELANGKYNKTPMFWDDIVFEDSESIKNINPESIVMDWGYEAEMPYMGRCQILKENRLRFYTCPGTSTWGSITGRFDNMIYNIESAAKSCIAFGGEGFLLTDWGDGGNPQFAAMSFLPYIYGACCAWHYNTGRASKSFIHSSYDKQTNIIKLCEEYADKFIFNEKNVSRILHKMANYYLVENHNIWNATNIWVDVEKLISGKNAELDIVTARQVEDYMLNIKKELSELRRDTPYLEEIECNCNMVILFARFIYNMVSTDGKPLKNDSLKNELIELKEEFLRLWQIKNRVSGSEIFAEKLDEMIDCIK